MSPGFQPDGNGNYDDNMDCQWTLTAPALNEVVQLSFDSFATEHNQDCSYDWVELYDGSTTEATVLDRLCGNPDFIKPFISIAHSMHVRMKTDGSVTENGVKFTWRFIVPSLPVTCVNMPLTAAGSTTSGGYSGTGTGEYNNNMVCTWTITALIGKIVILHFTDFSIEYQDDCSYDWVEIHDGAAPSAPSLGRYCGNSLGKTFLSSGLSLYIQMQTDGSVAQNGIAFSWVFEDPPVPESCGGTHSTPDSAMSLGYLDDGSGTYDNNMECLWLIQAPAGHRVQLDFDSFKVEQHNDCLWDWVDIYDGATHSSTSLGRYCGDSVTKSFITSGSAMLVRLRTDTSVGKNGIKFTWVFIAMPTTGAAHISSTSNQPNPTTQLPLESTTLYPTTRMPLESTTLYPTTQMPLESNTLNPTTQMPLESTTLKPTTQMPLESTTKYPTTQMPLGSTTLYPTTQVPLESTTLSSNSESLSTITQSQRLTTETTTVSPILTNVNNAYSSTIPSSYQNTQTTESTRKELVVSVSQTSHISTTSNMNGYSISLVEPTAQALDEDDNMSSLTSDSSNLATQTMSSSGESPNPTTQTITEDGHISYSGDSNKSSFTGDLTPYTINQEATMSSNTGDISTQTSISNPNLNMDDKAFSSTNNAFNETTLSTLVSVNLNDNATPDNVTLAQSGQSQKLTISETNLSTHNQSAQPNQGLANGNNISAYYSGINTVTIPQNKHILHTHNDSGLLHSDSFTTQYADIGIVSPGDSILNIPKSAFEDSETIIVPDDAPCGDIPHVENSLVNFQETRTGIYVTYKCLSVHQFPDGTDALQIHCDLSARRWSYYPQNCEAYKCPSLIVMNGELDTNDTSYDTVVTYTCDIGFRFTDGSTHRTVVCLDTGYWSSKLPMCTAVICESLPVPYSTSGTFPKPSRYGTRATFMCLNSKETMDNGRRQNTLICGSDGNWIGPDITCSEQICDTQHPTNAKVDVVHSEFGQLVVYACHEGYRFTDGHTIKTLACTDTVTDCIGYACPPVPTVPNTIASTTKSIIHTVVMYYTKDGYMFPNGSHTEQSRCGENLQWSEIHEPTAVSCGEPQIIPNTDIVSSSYTYGNTALYTCEEGYEFSDGTTLHEVYCMSNGNWSYGGFGNSCYRINCTHPTNIQNGRVSYGSLEYRATALYTCKYGYRLNKTRATHATSVCQADKTWSVIDPCTEIKCPPVPTWLNIIPNSSDTRPGTILNMSCTDGELFTHTNTTFLVVRCLKGGTWIPEVPACEGFNNVAVSGLVEVTEADNSHVVGVVIVSVVGVLFVTIGVTDIIKYIDKKQLKNFNRL